MANRLVVASGGLRGAVALASKLIQKRCRIPVLSHLRIRAAGDVRIEATDLENRLEIAIPRIGGDGTFDFDALLPCRMLGEYLKAASEDEVSLSADGLAVDLDHGRIVGCDPSDFPSSPDVSLEPVTEIDARELERALKSVFFARSSEVVRYALTGVLFEIGKGRTKGAFVASDGKRLAACPAAAQKARKAVRAIVAPTAALLLCGLAKTADGPIRIEAEPEKEGERQALRFSASGTSLFTRAIDGRFPDWEAVVPSTDGRASFVTDPAALARALDAVKVGVSEKCRAARFDCTPTQIRLFAKTADQGEASGAAPATGTGAAEIVLNVDAVRDYMESLPKKTAGIEILLAKPDQAAVFRIPGDGAVYVLMPLTIKV